MGSISKEYIDKVKDILIGETVAERDPAGIDSLIDQFPTSAVENLSNYWNESVNKFKTDFEKILPKVNWDKTNNKGHDAGYQFNESPYVNPNVNEINENYDDVRDTDALQAVLKNDEHLDYTIWNNKPEPIDQQIRKYITRLLMPRYKRRVEIEDLDRNFWVIGQNLTALNKIVLSIGDNLLNQLIAELCGLWDNIYRLWQLLINIEDEINKLSSGDKVRVMMEYGYGKLQSQENKTVVFTKDVIHEYGIVPYISTAYLINNGKHRYVAYMQYNKRLTNVNDDFLSNDSSLIKIEKKTRRDISKIMKYIRSRNFTLIAQSDSNCFSNLITVENPILKALDFYRDYLVYTEDADNGDALNIFFTDTDGKKGLGTWKQAGYFKHIDPNEKTTVAPTSITDDIRNSFSILMKLITDKLGGNKKCNFTYFCRRVVTVRDIETLKNILSMYTFDQLINDFYNLFDDCQRLVGIQNPPIFNTDNGTGYYSVPEEKGTIMNTFKDALKDYNMKYATEIRGSGDSAKYYFKMWKGGYLPTVVWDLLSMGSSRSGSLMNGFGQDYFYPYSKNEDHLWIDFVSNLKTDSCYDLIGGGTTIYNNTSLIGSITINDLLNSARSQEKDTLYDVNITVPINKNAASAASSSPKYHNFVRINRPYPNIVKLTQNTMNPRGSGSWSDLNHLKELNNDANWISSTPKSNGRIYYCVDGFYTFTVAGYASLIEEDSEIGSKYIAQTTQYNLDDILIYQISTSDMISCDHPVKGQSRISNLYNFEDPILNIRFINGKFKGQEIEIVTSKDKVGIPTTSIPDKPIITTDTEEETMKIDVEFIPVAYGSGNPWIYTEPATDKNVSDQVKNFCSQLEVINTNKIIIPFQYYQDSKNDVDYPDKGFLFFKTFLYLGEFKELNAKSKLKESENMKIFLRFWDESNNPGWESVYKVPDGWAGGETVGLYSHMDKVTTPEIIDGKEYYRKVMAATGERNPDSTSTTIATAFYDVERTTIGGVTTITNKTLKSVTVKLRIDYGFYKDSVDHDFGDNYEAIWFTTNNPSGGERQIPKKNIDAPYLKTITFSLT